MLISELVSPSGLFILILNINNNKNIIAIDIPSLAPRPKRSPASERCPEECPAPPGHCQALNYAVFWFSAPLWAGIRANEREKMKPLFVYGTLCPGRSNAHILEAIGGEWRPGYVTGTFYARGWGAAADFPGIVLDAHGPRVNGYLFLSDRLAAHWPMLDDFEEGYDRVPVEVTTDDGQQVSAWIYQLQPRE